MERKVCQSGAPDEDFGSTETLGFLEYPLGIRSPRIPGGWPKEPARRVAHHAPPPRLAQFSRQQPSTKGRAKDACAYDQGRAHDEEASVTPFAQARWRINYIL